MGCNCGGSTRTTSGTLYEYTAPDGSKQMLRSSIEAEAKVLRNGGTWRAVTR